MKKYAVFEGRARRVEYWTFTLVNFVVALLLGVVENVAGIAPQLQESLLASVFWVAVLLPSLAVGVRRLHDTGRSGWWLLLGLVPFAGGIVLLIFFVEDSDPRENRYGPNPKEVVYA